MKGKSNWCIVGISGVTSGGKTTLAKKLKEIYSNAFILTQDDYFLDVEDKRHTWIPELNHFNFDILESLDMDKMYCDLLKLIEKPSFNGQNSAENGKNGTNIATDTLLESANINLLIIEGFCIFQCKKIAELCNLKYFFTLDYEECKKRRQFRTYEPPDCPGYFDLCVWPEYKKYLKFCETSVENIQYFESIAESQQYFDIVLKDIHDFLKFK